MQSPAVPTFILRGHEAPIHALVFFANNSYLASGDSDGWVVIWSLASKRAVAVWKAHAGGVSAFHVWDSERLISHGRDHKLRVWKVSQFDNLSKTLPADGASDDQPQPWLLHSMDMSALNFCAFSACSETAISNGQGLLVASPNGLDTGGVDIFQLPREQRVLQIKPDAAVNTGMVMSATLCPGGSSDVFYLLSGYEDGQISMYSLRTSGTMYKAQHLALLKAHSQPVLSLALTPDSRSFFTSSADAHVVKFSLSMASAGDSCRRLQCTDTKHSGQQGLSVRSDGKIFATAGWDGRLRIYSAKTTRELAVLSWHKVGCYSTAFADLTERPNAPAQSSADGAALDIIRHERRLKAQRTHWLAAGGKDGKISLWDIY